MQRHGNKVIDLDTGNELDVLDIAALQPIAPAGACNPSTLASMVSVPNMDTRYSLLGPGPGSTSSSSGDKQDSTEAILAR